MDEPRLGFANNRIGHLPDSQRSRALERANRVRVARAELKRRLRRGEEAAAETILRGSRDIDTMPVSDLLLSQRGWGPTRCSNMLRSASLSERKTLGSLTDRQRVMLAALLSRDAERAGVEQPDGSSRWSRRLPR
jgi:hypothetical protein